MADLSNTLIPKSSRKIIRQHRPVFGWLQMILDGSAVVALLLFLTWNYEGEINNRYLNLSVLVVFLMVGVYNFYGYYSRALKTMDVAWNLFEAWLAVLLIVMLIIFVTKDTHNFSRAVLIIWALTAYVAQFVNFLICRTLQSRVKQDSMPTLIIGARTLGKHLADHINSNTWIPEHVIGVIDDDEDRIRAWDDPEIPVLGKLEQLVDLIAVHQIRRIYIALPMAQAGLIQDIFLNTVERNVDIIWAPDIFGLNLLNHQVRELAGVPLIALSETPLIGGSALMKSLMDKTLGVVAIIVASPILLLTALAVKLTSRGPVLFKQDRHGWDGKVFKVYKFRSMVVHDEEGTVTQATKTDPRITAVGKFIRRSSIDELPQLFNVVGGSMSLVGPRPHAVAHNEFYGKQINAYLTRHRVKPGLTGLAQVNGHRGETDTVDKMRARIEFDISYINNWSIWLDIEIIIRTVFVLLGKNAY